MKPLVVQHLVLPAALALLTACTSGAASEAASTAAITAPVELGTAQNAAAEVAVEYNELLDPEFGCGGPGYLEYGAGALSSK